MKAEIEFDYFGYAQLEEHVSFWLNLSDDDGNELRSIHIGSIDIPHSLIEYVGETVKVTNVYDALTKATVKLGEYWEE